MVKTTPLRALPAAGGALVAVGLLVLMMVVVQARPARATFPGPTMLAWLKRDLAANPARCTLAYFHRPRFSSEQNGNDATMRPIWAALYAANADVLISGHDHVYERFAHQTPRGIRSTACVIMIELTCNTHTART